jgi:YfiH family protein
MEQAVFSRQGGVSPAPFISLNLSVSVSDNEANVFANRARAYATHGRTNGTLVHAYLTHGSKVAQVTNRHNGQYVGPVDGLISNERNCGLTMNYADCSSIFLFDPANHAIALGHAGWKGAVSDLPGALVKSMQQHFGSDPASLLAGIGPSIGPCCYEVGEPVLSEVRHSFDDAESLLKTASNSDHERTTQEHRHFDLPEANRRRLERAGVKHVEVAELCTACRTDLFFSHRAEQGRTGRFGALIILK